MYTLIHYRKSVNIRKMKCILYTLSYRVIILIVKRQTSYNDKGSAYWQEGIIPIIKIYHIKSIQ